MLTKILAGGLLGLAVSFASWSPAVSASSGGPCACCGPECICTDCTCDADGCACDIGGDCACDPVPCCSHCRT